MNNYLGILKTVYQLIEFQVRQMFGQNGGCRDAVPSEITVPPTAAQTPIEDTATPTSGVTGNNEQAKILFDEVMKDCRLHEHRIFRIFCRPLGFKGSDVICEVTKKYKIGTRITKSDGRAYEIYRIKKTNRTRIENDGSMVWRAMV